MSKDKKVNVQDMFRIIESDFVPPYNPFKAYLEGLETLETPPTPPVQGRGRRGA